MRKQQHGSRCPCARCRKRRAPKPTPISLDRWAVVCEPGRIVFAERQTREECEALLADSSSRALAEKFGTPRVERIVIELHGNTTRRYFGQR